MFETALPAIKRLWYKSCKTGILENDIILSTFAQKFLLALTPEELHTYDRLLFENDWDVFYWATQQRPLKKEYEGCSLMKKLQNHTATLNQFENISSSIGAL